MQSLADIVPDGVHRIKFARSPDGHLAAWGEVREGRMLIALRRRSRDGAWSKVQKLDFGDAAQYFDPAISSDGRTLAFFSDRAGGFGGMDIWVSAIDPNSLEIGSPRNAGATINTPGDEWAPGWSPDGTFLFSSDGRDTAGGHALFLAETARGSFGEARKLAGSLDSWQDDFDATFVDGETIVFSRGDAQKGPVQLFITRRVGGEWDLPQKLSATINCSDFVLGPAQIEHTFVWSARCDGDAAISVHAIESSLLSIEQ